MKRIENSRRYTLFLAFLFILINTACEDNDVDDIPYSDIRIKPESLKAYLKIEAGDSLTYIEEGTDYFRAGSIMSYRVDGELTEYGSLLSSDSSLYEYAILYGYNIDERQDRINRIVNPIQDIAEYGGTEDGKFVINQYGFNLNYLKMDSLNSGGSGYSTTSTAQSDLSFFNVNEVYRSSGGTGNKIWLGGEFSLTIVNGKPNSTAPEQINGKYLLPFLF